RRGPQETIFAAAQCFWRNVLHLPRNPVKTADFATVNEIGVEWVRRDVAILLDADRMPVAEGDLSVPTPATHPGRTALLLAAIDPIRKLIVRDDVIELGGGLVVPGTPRLAAVDRDDRSLIRSGEDNLGVVRVDPDGVIIIAARRPTDAGEGRAAVGGAVHGGVGGIDNIWVLGIDFHFGEIAATPPDAGIICNPPPAFPLVVGAVDAPQARGV